MSEKIGDVPLAEVKLNRPIVMGSVTTFSIKFLKEPTLGDMDGLPMHREMDSKELAILLGRITDCDTPTLKHLTLKDTAELMMAVRPFLPAG